MNVRAASPCYDRALIQVYPAYAGHLDIGRASAQGRLAVWRQGRLARVIR